MLVTIFLRKTRSQRSW